MEAIIKYIKERKFVNTVADFAPTSLSYEDWCKMRANVDNWHWFSPSGKSEYLLVREMGRWNIYRMSNVWGEIGEKCMWTIGGTMHHPISNIGVCDIDDFKSHGDADKLQRVPAKLEN